MDVSSVLVLNQNYEPLNVCNVRRALVLVFRGKAEIIEAAAAAIHTASSSFVLPSVIRSGNGCPLAGVEGAPDAPRDLRAR